MKDSRDLMMQTAFKLFISKNYHQVTMQDIVNATGLSKGAFYHYFKSKEQVFEEVVTMYLVDTNEKEVLNLPDDSFKVFIDAYIQMVVKRVESYNQDTGDQTGILRANHYNLIFDAMRLLPDFRKKQTETQKQILEHWIRIINAAKKSNEIT